jgi:hypothetical protein
MKKAVGRNGKCALCGDVYDLEDGIKVDTPALITPVLKAGDQPTCLACFLEAKSWPGR